MMNRLIVRFFRGRSVQILTKINTAGPDAAASATSIRAVPATLAERRGGPYESRRHLEPPSTAQPFRPRGGREWQPPGDLIGAHWHPNFAI